MIELPCFKAYDIRGRLGIDLDDAIAYRIGRGFACALKAQRVVLGHDIRTSSESLARAVKEALLDEGCNVLNLGLLGIEEMYHAGSHFNADGGIRVTVSHNPIDYNRIKMVRAASAPLDATTGQARIKLLAEANEFGHTHAKAVAQIVSAEARAAYVERGATGTPTAAPIMIDEIKTNKQRHCAGTRTGPSSSPKRPAMISQSSAR